MYNALNKEQWMMLSLSLIAGMLGAVLINLVVVRQAPHIATINITGMAESYIKETTNQNLSIQEKQERIKHFASVLNKTTEYLAVKKHVVILPSEAVIAGSDDLTPRARELIKQELS